MTTETKTSVASASASASPTNRDPGSVVILTNKSGHTALVHIVNPSTQVRDQVFVQPGGRPKLEPGFVIDSVFAARNPHIGSIRKV